MFLRAALVFAILLVPVSARSGGASESEEPIPPGLDEGWYARIVTSKGTIIAHLHPEQAPQSVAHFTALAEGRLKYVDPLTGEEKQDHYYDGLLVHRAIAGERFETGDPTGTGRGAPPFYVPREGVAPFNFSKSGRLGMTGPGLNRISGVLFFVTVAAIPELNGKYPCFGTVIYGKEVAWQISSVGTDSVDKPREPVVVERIRVFKVGEPDPLPQPEPFVPKTLTPQVIKDLRER